MDKQFPKKRKSIHKNASLDEISDNVKNNAVVTRSKSRQLNNKEEDKDDSSDTTSNEDSEEDFHLHRRSDMIQFNSKLKQKQSHSEEVTDEEELQNQYNITPESRTRSNKQNTSTKVVYESDYKTKQSYTSDNNNISFRFVYFIICIIVALLFWLYMTEDGITVVASNKHDKGTQTDNVELILNDVKTTLKSLMSKYKNQDKNLWEDAYSTIANIIMDPKKPSIMILLGNESDPLDCLAVLLGNISSNALNTDRLLITPDNIVPDMGSVITSLKTIIKDKKAVIVWDLLNINIEALKAFHNLCDRVNPLVEEVLYIITVIADDYDKLSNPLEFVEKELFKKLSGKIKDDAIQPLITRITDGPILTVKPEPSITDCPLPKVTKNV